MLSLLAAVALQQLGPVLPVGAAPHLADLNLNIQKSLQQGDFEGARKLYDRWPTGSVRMSAEGVPAAYAQSLQSAALLLKEATGGRIEFVQGADATLVFTFGELPAEGPKDPVWRDGKVFAEIAVTDREGQPANPRSVTAAFAKGMAFAAGLDVSTRRRSLMGPLVYTRSAADATYSPREQTLFNQIEDVRIVIDKAMKDRTKLVPAVPNVSVTPDTVDFGNVTQGDREEFSITISNTGNAPAMIEIETTCACIVAQPSFILGPGETVTQKPRFDSTDYQGHLEKHLYVLSNSPGAPRKTILMKGLIVPEVRFVEPKGARAVHSQAVGDGLYEVEIAEQGQAMLELLFYGTATNLELVDVQLGNPSAKVDIAPFNGTVEDPMIGSAVRSGSKVIVRLPENWPYGVNWLRVVGVTNSRRKPSVELTLQIRKGIAASPQSMYFGDAKVGQESERTVMIEHGSKPFAITKLEASEGLTATFEKADDSSRRYQLTAKIRPANAGQISGFVKVHTDSKTQPVITVPIGGQAG